MPTIHLHHTDPTVQKIVSVAFPAYKGRHIQANVSNSIQFYGTQWDEGNKNEYVVVNLSNMARHTIETAPFMRRSALHENTFEIPPGFVVVCHHIGRYEHIVITGPSENISPMLPAPVELSRAERIVLCATRSLKSSYGGISNYRFHEAHRYTRISTSEWEQAKQSLMGKKYLSKNGAITVDGRNAIGDVDLYTLGRQTKAIDA